ncbi:MAG: glycine cleavage system protein H [Deltaproteobacteria bacterium]|nr:glycine cleavage system protein H [Deltaproteobacteria bacterium]
MTGTRPTHGTTESDPPCIWSRAGVVTGKACEQGYECTECRFDITMRKAAEEGLDAGEGRPIVPWQDKLRRLPQWKRPCIHHMKERIAFRACNRDYECGSCEFDQFFQDQFTVHAAVTPVDAMNIYGFRVPQGYYVHRGHAWVRIEDGGTVRVGLDEFALRLMGPPDRIEAPLMGKTVEQGRPHIRIERGDKQATVVSPVSGVVTAINTEVRESGRLANDDPFAGGWVMTVLAQDLRHDLRNLMINKETEEFMQGQVARLYETIEETAGPLAADGGELGKDIYGAMPELGWERLAERFLTP